jgi:glycosyltransferase involved in cell wall biosynthesis
VEPDPETAVLCERVEIHPGSLTLFLRAQRMLWPHWVALSVGSWTGEHGKWPLKLAPFLVPPFRTLLQNRNGDFFQGTPVRILAHCGRVAHDSAAQGWNGLREWLHASRVKTGERVRDASHAVGLRVLYILGILLGWLGYPHCRIFPRMHGSEPLPVEVEPSTGSGIVRFEQKGTHWDAKGLEKLARSSDARWILWHEGPAIDLPELTAAETFAVSAQPYFRAWKPSLFPMAAFRTLQPGEYSRVLAPLGPSILVDRRKLLGLGIPDCSLTGTAWMMLFWKAAAAGWRSYSVGQDAPLREQPDLPMQDTSFLLNLLRQSDLRRLGPRDADLARGTTGRMRFGYSQSGRLRVLLVSPFLPFPLSHGGAVRIYNLCKALASRVDFSLIAVREKNEYVDYARLHDIFPDVRIVDIDERPTRDGSLPAQVRQYRSASLRASIAEIAAEWRPDLLQVEYTHMASFQSSAPELPAILVEHDLTFSLYRQLADSRPGRESEAEYRRWLEFERRWLREYDGVWTVSDDDRKAAIREGSRDPSTTFSIPNGVDIDRFRPADSPGGTCEVLYVGSFRHLPNLLGFEKLQREVMPRVWARHAEVRLRVVAGPDYEKHTKDQLRGLDSRIEIHGFVEDLRPLYARASIVVVPLEVSAGTNIKVLEAMACGKPVVTTPPGCAGLDLEDDRNLFIRKDWDGFAEAVCRLVEDGLLRSRLGAAARLTAEARFSWTAIAERAMESYERLAVRRGLPQSRDRGSGDESLPSPSRSRSTSRRAVSQ